MNVNGAGRGCNLGHQAMWRLLVSGLHQDMASRDAILPQSGVDHVFMTRLGQLIGGENLLVQKQAWRLTLKPTIQG
jgi:hypothetical protein